MSLFYTKQNTPSTSEISNYSDSLIFSYGTYGTHNYGTIWAQGKQFGQNIYTTKTSYSYYLPILVSSYYDGGYIIAYHSDKVLINPHTGEFKAINFDGTFNGDFEGEFNGEFDGKFDGEFSGYAYAYGSFTGIFDGDFEGNFSGNHTGEFNGQFNGNGVLNGYVSSSYMTVISEKTDNVEYAVPFTPTSSTANNSYLYKDDSNGIKYNPSTNTLTTGYTISNINLSKPLDENLTVSGVTIGQLTNGTVISKDTTLIDLLKKMLCNEIDVIAQNPKISLSISPSSIYASSVSTTLTYTITLNDGKFVSSDTTNWDGFYQSNVQMAGCTMTSYSFNNGNVNSINNLTTIKGNITVTPGVNLDSLSFLSTASYTASTKIPHKNTGAESNVRINSGTATSSNVTVNIKYKYYMCQIDSGTATNIVTYSTSNYKGLYNDNIGTSKTISEWTTIGNKSTVYICVPQRYKITHIYDAVGSTDLIQNFSCSGTVTIDNVIYTTYTLNNSAQLTFKNITIVKN